MGVYQNVYKPFGVAAGEWDAAAATEASGNLDWLKYRTDWPGIVGTAAQLGVDAASIATGAQPLAPGAGVTAPGSTAPELLQAPPAGTPGISTAGSTPPWLLIGGAALLYFVFLK